MIFMRKQTMPALFTLAIAVVISVSLLTGCSGGSSGEAVRIVHKNYTEQRIIGQMLSVFLENRGFETEVKELGGTMLTFNALVNDDADLYAEYTGTAYMAILNETEILPTEETYNFVSSAFNEEYGISWLNPLGFNNTYILSVTNDTQRELGLNNTSDLIPYSKDMIIGSDSEFVSRTDGLPGLLKAYPGMEFAKTIPMDQGLTYEALRNGELDVNVSFSTDGRIAKFDLVNLEDDAGFFPPYYCVPIIRQDLLEAKPEVGAALEELNNLWTDEDMQEYNLAVDEGANVRDIATQMLEDAGVLQ